MLEKNSNLNFLLTFSHFFIFYDHDGLFEMILGLKKFGFEKVDQKSKFDFFLADEISSDDSEFV